MSRSAIVGTGVAVLIAAGLYYFQDPLRRSRFPEVPSPISSPVAQSPAPPPPIRYAVTLKDQANPSPLPGTAPKTLPQLDDSDESILTALTTTLGKGRFAALLNPKGLVRRFVITVDRLTEPHSLSADYSIVTPVEGAFEVSRDGGNHFINQKNYARYDPYVSLLDETHIQPLVAIYTHFYPLFQTAFHDVKPTAYFNDRLIEVIDHLLETPYVEVPIQLLQTSVYYRYKNVRLEGLSVGQKSMIRTGPANTKIILSRLKALRQALTQLGH